MEIVGAQWHAGVTLAGPWSPSLGYTLDHISSAPAVFDPRCRRIGDDTSWFLLAEVELPVNERRPVPLCLHVAAITGAIMAPELSIHLLRCADLVVFVADSRRSEWERTVGARAELDLWLADRGDAARIVYQLDRHTYGVEMVSLPEARRDLAAHEAPLIETDARNRQGFQVLFREVVDQLLAARNVLPPRPRYA